MVKAVIPAFRRGFREAQGCQPEPRPASRGRLRYGKTALRMSAGLFHNPRLAAGNRATSRQPAVHPHPDRLYTAREHAVSSRESRSRNRPVQMEALEVNAQTPSITSGRSACSRTSLGHGRRRVVRPARLGRHLEMHSCINPVPDGARFLEANATPPTPVRAGRGAAGRVPAAVQGLSGHPRAEDWGRRTTTRCSAVNRRYIRGLQVGVLVHVRRALGIADEDTDNINVVLQRPIHEWHYAPLPSRRCTRW